jgi:hypothetical protein
MTDAEYTAEIVRCIGILPYRQVVDAPPGTLNRISDSEIIQVVLNPAFRESPVYTSRETPLLIGMWVRRLFIYKEWNDGVLVDKFLYEDGILMANGNLWSDRDSTGKQRFEQYWYIARI